MPLSIVAVASDRSDVIHRELADLAEVLRPVADPRGLAFAIVGELIAWCGAQRISPTYGRSIAEVALLLGLAKASATTTAYLDLWCERADRLCSRFFSRGVPGAPWTWEHRVPWELANALRRACETEPTRFLPLIVRDGRGLLADLGGDPGPIEQRIDEAIAWGYHPR